MQNHNYLNASSSLQNNKTSLASNLHITTIYVRKTIVLPQPTLCTYILQPSAFYYEQLYIQKAIFLFFLSFFLFLFFFIRPARLSLRAGLGPHLSFGRRLALDASTTSPFLFLYRASSTLFASWPRVTSHLQTPTRLRHVDNIANLYKGSSTRHWTRVHPLADRAALYTRHTTRRSSSTSTPVDLLSNGGWP